MCRLAHHGCIEDSAYCAVCLLVSASADLPWSAATLKTVTEVTSVQITKSGKEIVHKQPAASSAAAASGKASAGASTGSSSGDEDTVTSHSTTRSAAAGMARQSAAPSDHYLMIYIPHAQPDLAHVLCCSAVRFP
jgi:hypothetical protein